MSPPRLPALRHRRLWFALGVVMVAVISYYSLIPTTQLPELHVSDKVEHTLAYVALGFWFGSLVERRHYPALALALLAFGGLIELAQALMDLGRQADWHDLVANAVGVAIGLCLAATPLGRWAYWIESHLGVRRS